MHVINVVVVSLFKDVFQSCGIEKEVLYEKNGSDEFIDSRANKYRCIAHNQDDL